MKRYPGIRPFTFVDQHLFKGRDRESRELFQLVVLNEVVVLFGKSGIGKTSLLQAGVCPELEDRNLHPVFIRINETKLKPEEQIYQILRDGGYIPKDTPPGQTLWEYLKKFYYVDLGEVFQPVLIFDQFEELFTLYKPEDRYDFITQFADVVNGSFPDSLKSMSDDGVETPPEVKIVIAIRSDYLYLLDELSAYIPSILRTRFQLKTLDKENASEAITKPASTKGKYDSPHFSFSNEALDNIINTLGKDQSDQLRSEKISDEPAIEASHLQLFCGYIETKIIKENMPEGFVITPDYYGGEQGIQEIISQFYEQVINNIEPENREQVERMLAQGLIRNKRRIIMEESVIRDEYKISKDLLTILDTSTLLNKEARKGSFYYEISHDTLIGPILKKFESIRLKEEEAKREAEKLAREKELEAERQKRKRTRWLAIIGFALASVAVIALFLVWQRSKELKLARSELNRQDFNNIIEIARSKKVEGLFEEAINILSEADSLSLKLGEQEKKLLQILKLQWIQVDSLVSMGDSLSAIEAFHLAVPFYQQAYEISPDQRIKKLETDTQTKLEEKFKNQINSGDQFFQARLYDLAKQSFEAALQLKPDDPVALKKLEETMPFIK